ncbi:MAG: 16S rRNA (cytidine(1402)-2'-O)-methyltransferase [Deltaproteobacteria bacterium]|nr:16S rRNA (cytidine(1402)-2'-O)-methyltransferase [Deltaproteobacteria bacterium]
MGTLHVIATPIGNLDDITLRALAELRATEVLYAEDTRRTRILLDRHGIPVRARSLHAHNEAERCAEALAALAEGRRVALVSDAGTPTVSDPGARLAAEAIAAGHTVVALPGASAVLTALVVSGLPATPFTFVGFLPRRGRERSELIDSLRSRPETLVFFESPQRIADTLGELADALGDRRGCVARELTKLHEEAARGTLRELAARFAEGARGEITLVVEGARAEDAPAPSAEALRRRVAELLASGLSPRDVADALRGETRLPRRELYALALTLRAERAAESEAE